MIKEYFNKAIKGVAGLFKGGFFHILTGNVMNKAVAMISSIVIARIVDKVQYADLSYADNIYAYIALLSGLGMSSALLKFASTNNSVALNKAYLQFAYKVGSLFELLASVAACIGLMVFNIPYPNARIFAWALVFYPVLTHINTTNLVFARTQLENKKYAKGGVLQSVSVCVLSILFLLLFGVYGIVAARYVALLVTLIYTFSFVKNLKYEKETSILTREQKKAFVTMGISLGLASFFSGIMPINEAFLVNNIIRDEITTSNFRVAGLFPQLLNLISGAITVYYFPIVARLKDAKEIKKKVLRIEMFNFMIVFAATALGMLLTPFALDVLYGGKYNDAISISYVLWLMRGMHCILRAVPMNMLPAIGKTSFNVVMSVIACVLQCVLDCIFLLKFGVVGVALGSIIVYLISGIGYWIYFHYCCRTLKF